MSNSLDMRMVTDMTNEDYHAEREHISRSAASRYRGVTGGRSQYYEEVKGKKVFTGNSATSFGTLVDIAFESVAKGTDWRSAVTVPPPGVLAADGSRRGKAFTEWRSSLPSNAIECNATDFEKVSDIIESIHEHKLASYLLQSVSNTQLSVFWTDEDGHKRKARADGVSDDEWFDLKTTSSEWHELKRSFRKYAYDWQAAWYTDAALAAGWKPFRFRFIVVQTFAPYDVFVCSMEDDEIANARAEIAVTLDAIASRRVSGNYVSDDYHAERVIKL